MTIAPTNPFVGLRPFESGEDLLFFGRKEQTLELMQRLHKYHFVAVIGSSGSGKSSLIKAGLIPGLQAGYLLNDSDRWIIASMKPGQDPLYNLADAVQEQLNATPGMATSADLVKKVKEEGADALLKLLSPLWKEKYNFFLLVDQFEELFRFSTEQQGVEKKDEAIEFVNALLELSQQPGLPIYVVITMRSDFIGDCTQFFGLPEALNQSQYLVPRLNRTQLKTTIEGPVKLFNGKISPVLTARLLNDVQVVKDELPLLQHALMRTWNYEVSVDKSGELDLHDYESIGGIEKALSNHADEALAGMTGQELLLTKKLFQSLTAIDENGRKIRKPATLTELEAISGADKKLLLLLINRFIGDNRSFLVLNKSGDDVLVDISHESLIRQWSTLSAWVDEEMESGKMYLRLVESGSLHKDNKKDLLSGSELDLALRWYADYKPSSVWGIRYSKFFEQTINYLKESERDAIALEKKRKINRNKVLLSITFLTTLIIIVLSAAYINSKKNTRIAERQRAIADSNATLAVAQRALADSSSLLAKQQKSIADSSALEAKNQTAVAQLALNNAEAQKIIAENKTGEAIAQKEANISLLTKNYWDISQTARRENNLLKGLEYLAEAAYISNDQRLTKNLLNDVESFLPQASLKEILKLNSKICSVAFSADGKQILTADRDDTRRWNAVSGKQIGPTMEQRGIVLAAAFSPDDEQVLIASGSIAQVWSAVSGKITGPAMEHNEIIKSACYSPDGGQIVTAGGNTVQIWSATSKKKTSPAIKLDNTVLSAVFSPDGKRVLTANYKTALLWDALSGKKMGSPMEHDDYITSAVFSADGKKVVTASFDSTVQIWDAFSGEKTSRAMKHADHVESAVFSRDSKRVLTKSADNTARIWNVGTGLQTALMKHKDRIESAVFSIDGTQVLTASDDNTVRVWDAETGEQTGPSIEHENGITLAVYSPGGKQILTAGKDKTVRLWNVASRNPTSIMIEDEDYLKNAAFNADGTKLLTSSGRLFDAISGKRLVPFMDHHDPVYSAVFSPDGNQILTGSWNRTAQIWDISTAKQNGPSLKHKRAVISALYSPDGKRIVTACADYTVWLWDALSRKQIVPEIDLHNQVYCVAFSADGKQIITACGDGNYTILQLWSSATGKKTGPEIRYEAVINSIVFSADNRRILFSSDDKTARIYDLPTGRQIGPSMKHNGKVGSAVFNRDESQVVTAGGADKTARIWDVATGKQIGAPLEHKEWVNSAVFSSDGRRILTTCHDKTAHIWPASGDLDLPPWLFLLQTKVATGSTLNVSTGSAEFLPGEKWKELKTEYLLKAYEHYRVCQYSEYNFWKRFYSGNEKVYAKNKPPQ